MVIDNSGRGIESRPSNKLPVMPDVSESIDEAVLPSFREAAWYWFRLGFLNFGGPSGQIAMMHEGLVERRQWVSEDRFLNALNVCMLLPGPEAHQLAIYLGWLMHGARGGLVAGVCFVWPAAVLLGVLSWVYVQFGEVTAVHGIFEGLKPAVLAIVLAAVLRVGMKTLKTPFLVGVATLAWLSLTFLKVPFPALIFGVMALGWLVQRMRPVWLGAGNGDPTSAAIPNNASEHDAGWKRLARGLVVGLLVWLGPLVVTVLLLGGDHTLTKLGLFFSKAALVTFGGAYAVLPYVSQQAVEHYGWLTAPQMLSGLALAETTPGPLIIVLQFVGFLAGWQHPDGLPQGFSAVMGAALTSWCTFVPSFIFIFLFAPFVERLRQWPGGQGALKAVTAAVVGVIFNLAVWFGLHVVWQSEASAVDWLALAIASGAIAALWFGKVPMGWIILASAAIGLMQSFWH